jgi:hypothetical protein
MAQFKNVRKILVHATHAYVDVQKLNVVVLAKAVHIQYGEVKPTSPSLPEPTVHQTPSSPAL